jgi:FixJ family two-component response regulator
MPRKPVVSIVDDDPSVRDGTVDLLNALGYIAEAFDSALDFLNAARCHGTSCLIVDVQLPGMSGLELYENLVAAGRSVPTIVVTAFPDELDRARALRAGVSFYLTKPFEPDELLACIRAALARRTENPTGN